MRLFLHYVMQLSFDTADWDITAAYLHSVLNKPLYVRPPHGLERYDDQGNLLYMKLVKSLYGLRQSGHNWMNDLFDFLREYGMTQSPSDTSLWFHRDGPGNIDMVLFVHTDDGKLAYKTQEAREHFMRALRAKFNVGDETDGIDRIFNIKVIREPSRIKLTQKAYILDLANNYNLEPNSRVTAPMTTGYRVILKPELSPKDREAMRTRPFTSLLSALLWVARCTRPDINLALTVLARAASQPDPSHWTELVKILKYLVNTIERGIVIFANQPDLLRCMTDASHASDPVTMRSVSGVFVLVGRNIIDWYCRHQPYVTLHSGEAETLAASTGATFLLYWIQLIEHMTQHRPYSELLTDSTTARNFLSTPLHTSKMRHINVKLFFVRELVKANMFRILHVAGLDNPPDLLTKPLSRDRIDHLLQTLLAWGGAPPPPADTLKAVLPSLSSATDASASKRQRR